MKNIKKRKRKMKNIRKKKRKISIKKKKKKKKVKKEKIKGITYLKLFLLIIFKRFIIYNIL